MKNLIRHPVLISTIVAIAAITVGLYSYNALTSHPSYDYTHPVVKDVTENVVITGQVKSPDVVTLAFERAGKVARNYVSVGDHVTAGQTLVALSAQDALDDLASAKATLALAQAQAGISGTQSDNSKAALVQAQTALLDKVQSAYIASDDAVRTQTSSLFTNAQTTSPILQLSVSDSSLYFKLQNERRDLETMLINWNQEISKMSGGSTSADWDSLSSDARKNISSVRQFLDDMASALNNSILSPAQPATSIAAWKLAITTSRANVGNAQVALSGADSQLTSAKSAYAIAQQQVQSGVTLSVSQAQVQQAQVAVNRAESALSKTVLRAPFDGVVTRVDSKVGQTVAIGNAMAGMISNANYQIEGYVSEADAAKIKNGQTAHVTLDAYGSSVLFPVKVALVDPAETVQNGVSSYKITFEFVGNDERVKSGMTANVSVFVDAKQNVLTVPESAIVRRGADEFVLAGTPGGAAASLTKVTTGLRGDDGSVEIISGLTASSSIVSLNK